jgi:hypothetical protein
MPDDRTMSKRATSKRKPRRGKGVNFRRRRTSAAAMVGMSPEAFAHAARSQSAKVAASPFEADDQAFIDSISEFVNADPPSKIRRTRE